jgi:hypothetical protein
MQCIAVCGLLSQTRMILLLSRMRRSGRNFGECSTMDRAEALSVSALSVPVLA